MKDFGSWFGDQGKGETEEVDDVLWITCSHCGKSEPISKSEWESGDSDWYVEDWGDDTGLCCGGLGCTP